jgi:hypothetical protein
LLASKFFTMAKVYPQDEAPVENMVCPVEGGTDPNRKLGSGGMFGFTDKEAIKQKVRDAKAKPDAYDVKQFYYESGFFSNLASHIYFENTTLGVIMLNAIWIGVDTDHNRGDNFTNYEPIFIAVDTLFFTYFSFELVVRFLAFKKKQNCVRDAWFCFDTTLVVLYLFDPFIVSLLAWLSGGDGVDLPTAILRLFRLARLSRLVRMLRSLPELMILIKGILTATTAVAYNLGLLLLATYIFAIVLAQVAEGYEFREMYFSSVAHAMYSLIIYGGFVDDLAAFCDPIKAESTICLMIVTVYVVLSNVTLMNMLIGVLCEVIEGVANEEREGMMVEKVYNKFGDIVKTLDSNANGMISWEEFRKLLSKKEALAALDSVNVDAEGMIDVAEEYFFDDGEMVELTFQQFMDMVLELRGGQQAMVKDVISLGNRFTRKFADLKGKLESMKGKMEDLKDLRKKPAG